MVGFFSSAPYFRARDGGPAGEVAFLLGPDIRTAMLQFSPHLDLDRPGHAPQGTLFTGGRKNRSSLFLEGQQTKGLGHARLDWR